MVKLGFDVINEKDLLNGVPQASVLETFLFNIFVNHLF